MSVQDETGFPESDRLLIEKLLKPKKEDRIDREHVRSTIESPGWKVFWDRVIKPQLDDWKMDLISNVDLPEAKRKGIILARTTLLEGFARMYERTSAHVPEWFENELKEMGR